MKWEEIRERVDIAVRAGRTKDEFCEENDINRGVWYKIKPKGFKWRSIQLEKGIKVKRAKKKKPVLKPIIDTFTPAKLCCTRYGCDNRHDEVGICTGCKVELLESLMIIYRGGFTDDAIRGVLG